MRILNMLKTSVIVSLLILLAAPALNVHLEASAEVVAQLRLYEGFKEGTPAPAKVVSSYYLKPIKKEPVVLDVDIEKEQQSLKKVFSLEDIKMISRAGIRVPLAASSPPFQLGVVNGRHLMVQLEAIKGKRNRFQVEVLEQDRKESPLLETSMFLPQEKTTVLGFEDSTGRIYFISFSRGKNLPSPPMPKKTKSPIDIKEIERPRLIKSVPPKYPKEALKVRVEGEVVLDAVADEQGKVVKIVKKTGHPLLTDAAIDALRQWQYEPYVLNNEPRKVRFTVRVNFRLHGKKKGKSKEPQPRGRAKIGHGPRAGVKGGPVDLPSSKKPRLISGPPAKYPVAARKAGIQGKVVVELVVNEKGRVTKASVIDGIDQLNQAALDAVKKWVFEPYTLEGKSHQTRFTVVVKFHLN